jgi:hypothetical protein
MWAPSISTASRPDALRAGGFKPMAPNSMEARQTNCGVAILEAASATGAAINSSAEPPLSISGEHCN